MNINKKWGLATFLAIFSQAHLVTLLTIVEAMD
jgi:hypothetical protein